MIAISSVVRCLAVNRSHIIYCLEIKWHPPSHIQRNTTIISIGALKCKYKTRIISIKIIIIINLIYIHRQREREKVAEDSRDEFDLHGMLFCLSLSVFEFMALKSDRMSEMLSFEWLANSYCLWMMRNATIYIYKYTIYGYIWIYIYIYNIMSWQMYIKRLSI